MVSNAGIVYVVGDVHKPLGVTLVDAGPITVLQALATAQGANPTASLDHAKILRKGEYGRTEIPVDIKKMLLAKAQDVALQADDILFVPRRTRKSAVNQQKHDFYDVPPSGPLEGPASIYPRSVND